MDSLIDFVTEARSAIRAMIEIFRVDYDGEVKNIY